MAKIAPIKPVLIILYGYPGSGKSHFASQFCEDFYATHIYGDKIRHELFEKPEHNKRENEVVEHLMQYMTEEFLRAGVSVVYDSDALRLSDRRTLRELARKYQARHLLIWLQVDVESAFLRVARRDRRKLEDKFASQYDRSTFDDITKIMQNPKDEDYVVISGKHTFNSQKNTIIKKMYEQGLVNLDSATARLAKPNLVNLIPPVRARRVESTRRNIVIT